MRKIGYRFNPETLSYDKIVISWRKQAWNLSKKLFSSFSLAIVIYCIVSNFWESPGEKAQQRENEQLLAQYKLLNTEISKLDEVLRNLEQRDDNIYRVIFEAEPIDASIRRAGSGGVSRYDHLKNMKESELLINTSRRLDNLSKALYIQSKSYDEIEVLAKSKIQLLASIPAILPISLSDPKVRLSSAFGNRMHPYYKTVKFHSGMDFSGPTNTPIRATGEGVVVSVSMLSGYGKCIVIDHGFSYETLYGHLNNYNVKAGQKVKRGDVIGYMGNTGMSIGTHLHYEVRKNAIPVNPINYYFNDLTPNEYDALVALADNTGQAMD